MGGPGRAAHPAVLAEPEPEGRTESIAPPGFEDGRPTPQAAGKSGGGLLDRLKGLFSRSK
jgi:hypothetical protein